MNWLKKIIRGHAIRRKRLAAYKFYLKKGYSDHSAWAFALHVSKYDF